MSSAARATVVVPLLSQRDDWLRVCLLSALRQTASTSVVVVTAADTPASNRETLETLRSEHENLEFFERPTGHGFAQAINAGFEFAATPRVGLLLSDDWLLPDAVESCLAVEADMVVTGRQAYAADGTTPLWRRVPSQETFDALDSLEKKAGLVGHFFLFRRERFLAVGGVDPDIGLTGADDYDLPWTLLEDGVSVRIVERALYGYRDHEETRLTLRDRELQVRDLRRVLAKHGLSRDEIERLVHRKEKWFGAPGHYVIENPDWYRERNDGDGSKDG